MAHDLKYYEYILNMLAHITFQKQHPLDLPAFLFASAITILLFTFVLQYKNNDTFGQQNLSNNNYLLAV